MMKSFSRIEKTLLIVLVMYSLIPALVGMVRVVELAGGPQIGLPENTRALSAPIIVGLHIVSSIIYLILGALSFLPSIRRNNIKVHRLIGRTVAAAGCLSAATGLWMTHFFSFPAELQGTILYIVRMILGLYMIGLIAWAVISIRNRNLFQHSASMLLAYAIGLGASTQTFVGIGWVIATGNESVGLVRDGLMVLSWAINLLVAEWLIQKYLRKHLPPNRQVRKAIHFQQPKFAENSNGIGKRS